MVVLQVYLGVQGDDPGAEQAGHFGCRIRGGGPVRTRFKLSIHRFASELECGFLSASAFNISKLRLIFEGEEEAYEQTRLNECSLKTGAKKVL